MNKGIVSYGQHYLDNVILQEVLVDSAKLGKSDVVLEIGAGDGRITEKLAKKAGQVVAYEIDEATKPELDVLCKKYNNLVVKFENFLETDIPLSANKIVASLPYQITEPFIEKIKNRKQFESITLLVGKTFGIFAKERPENLTKLYLLTTCFFDSEYLQDVDKSNFTPPPKTMSSIINLYPKSKDKLLEQPSLYLMREIFEQRDKKIANALREAIIRFFEARGEVVTKRQSKEMIANTFEPQELDKYLEQTENKDIEKIFNKFEKLLEKA